MIKYSYSLNITCSICAQLIVKDEATIIAGPIGIGYLNNLIDISDNPDGWEKELGADYIKYTSSSSDDSKKVFRTINKGSLVNFPNKFPNDIQHILYDLRNKIDVSSPMEFHLNCYVEILRKINQILGLKAFM